MCVIETGANFHLTNSRTWQYARGLKQFSTHAMAPPDANHTTGGIAFCLSPRMAPFFSKLVSHHEDRFCELHLNCKRGVKMVLIGAHAHPSPLANEKRLKAKDMQTKITACIRTNRLKGNKVFLMGDLNWYPTSDLDKFVEGPGLPHRYKPIFQDLINDNFLVDTFCHLCPTKRTWTHSGETAAGGVHHSRLDLICVDEADINSLVSARIDYLPGLSDHPGIPVAQLFLYSFWRV